MATATKMLTVTDAAAQLDLDPSQVRRHIKSGALKATRMGERLWLIDLRDLVRFAKLPRQSGPKKKSEK